MESFSLIVVVGDVLVVLSLIFLITIDKPLPAAPLEPIKASVAKPTGKSGSKRSA